jgi:GGDEF domain-containing protein
MRPQDKLGRWTGVEFLYLLPRTDQRHAEFLAQGLHAYFCTHPLSIREKPVALALHIGVASYVRPGMDLDDLLQQANLRMRATIPVSAK